MFVSLEACCWVASATQGGHSLRPRIIAGGVDIGVSSLQQGEGDGGSEEYRSLPEEHHSVVLKSLNVLIHGKTGSIKHSTSALCK